MDWKQIQNLCCCRLNLQRVLMYIIRLEIESPRRTENFYGLKLPYLDFSSFRKWRLSSFYKSLVIILLLLIKVKPLSFQIYLVSPTIKTKGFQHINMLNT